MLAHSGCRDLTRRFSEIPFSPHGARVWGTDRGPPRRLFSSPQLPCKPCSPKIKAQSSHNNQRHWGSAGLRPALAATFPVTWFAAVPPPVVDKLQPRGSARSLDRADASCGTVDKEADNVACARRLLGRDMLQAASTDVVQLLCPGCFNKASNRALTCARMLGSG